MTTKVFRREQLQESGKALHATEVRGAHFVNVAEVRKLRIRVLDTGGGLKVSWERSSGEGGPTPQASSEESLDSGRSPEVKRGGGTLPTSPSEGWASWYKLVKESTGRTAVPDIILAVAKRYRIRMELTTGNWVKIPVR